MTIKNIRAALYAAQNGKCHYCGERMSWTPERDDSLTLDHIIPRALGGTNAQTNLIACCRDCNNRKGMSPYWAFKAFTSLYGKKRITEVMRSLSRERYEHEQRMWDALHGIPHVPVIKVELPIVVNGRRPWLELTRRLIAEIVESVPFTERNIAWHEYQRENA